jgi:hypothetical protein
MATDKKFFNIYGGLDTRAEIDKDNKKLLFMEGAKNIDINGKNVRRARGQTSVLEHTNGWLGLHDHEVGGISYMRGIDDEGNYFRINESDGSFNLNDTFSDISKLVYSGKYYNFNIADIQVRGLYMKSDGTKMYVADVHGKRIYQYTLSTPWDVSTALSDGSFSNQVGTLNDIWFKPDGTKLYTIDTGSTNRIDQFTLSTPWDVTTATYDNISKDVGSNTKDIAFNSDGTKLHILRLFLGGIDQYTLSTPWDVSTALSDGSLDISGQISTRGNFCFSEDGKILLVSDNIALNIFQYTLSTAWNVTTGIYSGISINISTSFGLNKLYALFISNNNNVYMISYNAQYFIHQTSQLSVAKSSLVGTSPYFFQFQEKLIVITGGDDPFADSGTSITQTGFYTQWGVYGSVGMVYNNNVFIADGKTLYWAETNTYNEWNADYYKQFDSDIIGLKPFGSYMMIWTKTKVYYLSGFNSSEFSFQEWGDYGVFSKYANCLFDNNIYTFCNNNFYPIEVTGDMAQTRFVQSLSYKIQNLLEEVDQDRLDEVLVVPYEKRKQIWVYIPVSGESGIYKAYIFNFLNHIETNSPIAIYTRESNPITCATPFKGEIYTGTSDGKIYKEDEGSDFDGVAIVSDLKFTEMTFGTSKTKKLKDFMAWLNPNYDNKFIFYYIVNGNISNKKSINIDLSAKKDNNKDRLSRYMPIALNQFSNIQIGISTDALDEDYELLGFEFLGLMLSNSVNQI